MLVHDLSSAFLVFIDKIQADMGVTKEQKDKLDQYLGKLLTVANQTLQKSKEWRPEERETYDWNIHEEMAPTLNEILHKTQRVRLSQLERQREGLFGSNFYWKDLKVTDAQRQQFVPIIQQADKRIQDLLAQIHNLAEADQIRPKVFQCRKDLEKKLEDILTDPQKEQWKEMTGEPIEADALFGSSSQ